MNEALEILKYSELLSTLFGSPSEKGSAQGNAKVLAGMLIFMSVCRTFGLQAYGAVLGEDKANLSDDEKVRLAHEDMKSSDESVIFAKFFSSLLSAAANEGDDGSGKQSKFDGSFFDVASTIVAKVVNVLVDKGVPFEAFSERVAKLSEAIVPQVKPLLESLVAKGGGLTEKDVVSSMAGLILVADKWVLANKSPAAKANASRELSPDELAYKKDVEAIPETEGFRDAAELFRVMEAHGRAPVRPGLVAKCTSASGFYALCSRLEAAGYLCEKVMTCEQTVRHDPSYSLADGMMRSFSIESRKAPGYSAVLAAFPKHGLYRVNAFACSASEKSSEAWWEALAGKPVPVVSDAASAESLGIPAPFIS